MVISVRQTELFDIKKWRSLTNVQTNEQVCVFDLGNSDNAQAQEVNHLLTNYGIRNYSSTIKHRDNSSSLCIAIDPRDVTRFQEICERKELAIQLWHNFEINELRNFLKKYPDEEFTLYEPEEYNPFNETVTICSQEFDEMEQAYERADLKTVFNTLKKLGQYPIGYRMPDGRFAANNGNTFLQIMTEEDHKKKFSGLKIHIPVHINHIPQMECIMRSMYDVNEHFGYKFAIRDINSKQAGKVLTIYVQEGLDTPVELQKFFSILDQKMKEENIRLYSKNELKEKAAQRHESPNLLDSKQEWQVHGAEGRFFYSYDGYVQSKYNGYLKYSVQNKDYVPAGGSREHLKATNNPFEEVNLNLKAYQNPLTKNALANDPLPEGVILRDGEINKITGKEKSEIIIGSAMGENAQAFIRELYKRAKEAGIISDKYADKYGTPSSYRLVLKDTPENRAFINAHVAHNGTKLETPAFALTKINAGYHTSDAAILRNNHPLSKQELPKNGTFIFKGCIYIGSAMGENAQKFIRELSIRAVKAGIFADKKADKNNTPSSYHLVFKDTPENRAFINAHIKPDGHSIYTQEEAQNKIHPKPTQTPYTLGAYVAQRKTYG